MSTYQQQLAKCKDTDDENSYSSIWRNSVWTITDYEELFEDIDRGYIIQDPEDVFFIINPDWEGEEEEEDSDDEEEDSDDEDCVAHPVYNCDGGCGTIMGSDDDCKRICDDCENVGCDADCGKDATYQNNYGDNYCSNKCEDREEEDSDDEDELYERYKQQEEDTVEIDEEKEKEEEKKQKDILHSQLVWKIYFGAVLQDIREREEEEEEKEKNNCIECNVVITKDNIYEPPEYCHTEPDDLCEKCGDDYKECVVCNEWCCNEALYFDEDNECKICDDCGNIEFEEIDENVEKINLFVENYKNGEYIGIDKCATTDIDAIMKLINKLL